MYQISLRHWTKCLFTAIFCFVFIHTIAHTKILNGSVNTSFSFNKKACYDDYLHNPILVEIEFDSNSANPAPAATNADKMLGAVKQPIALHSSRCGNTLYELSTYAQSNAIDNFSNDFAGDSIYVEASRYVYNIDNFRVSFSTADFSYKQSPCNPLSITFKNETPGSIVIDWDFGNGINAPGNNNPTIQYPSFGSYDVTLTVINSSGIKESVTKSIAVEIQNASLIITNDTSICAGSSIQFHAVNALNYCWTPASTLNATNIVTPIATPITSTVYYLNSSVVGNNLIVNGNFSSGNTGFTTGYSYAKTNTTEGEYYRF